ncbi:hypothetical protein [Shewanella colwelliana]|uniref:hypothetical protein n=1 Tax=Shewanella colwelliana TaxID=23 RepID=UPI0022AF5A5A|nr:hypothetical protein [Shewanella colwelliana]MCZ4336703.1 hypothetical protein [Shewanella colwelliana]
MRASKWILSSMIACAIYFVGGCSGESDGRSDTTSEVIGTSGEAQFNLLVRELYDSIESHWDGEAGWMNYSSGLDVRYQESITFLLFMDSTYGTNNKSKIVSSIKYSLEYLQDGTGAFYIEGDLGYVRTSLYIVGMLKAIEVYPEIVLEVPNIEESIKSAANWIISVEKEWGGNHQIFGLIAFELLTRRYNDVAYSSQIARIKFNLVSDFVHVNDEMGYFPEGPKEWDNRLLMPIVQTQIMATGFYLSLTDDSDMKLLLEKTIRSFVHYFDSSSLRIDITDSYDFGNKYQPLGVHTIPIEVPSVLLYSCLYIGEYCDLIDEAAEIKLLHDNMRDNFVRDNYLTLFTDPYYRFAVMETIFNKES